MTVASKYTDIHVSDGMSFSSPSSDFVNIRDNNTLFLLFFSINSIYTVKFCSVYLSRISFKILQCVL